MSYEEEKNVNLIIIGLIHVLQLFLNGKEIWIMKPKDKSRLTATKMVFMRHTAANNPSSEKLNHFCSCLYLTWCTLNMSVCFIFYFCSLSRGDHMGMIVLSTKFTSCDYAHINILKCDVAIKIFPFFKFGCGEPVSPLACMLQRSYPIHKCNSTYIHSTVQKF